MKRSRAPRFLLVALAGSVALIGFACGGGPKLYPVVGQVFVDGEPAVGAIVVLHPVGNDDPAAPRPIGKVKGDGSFHLSTPPYGSGAPAGEYEVAIVWPDESKFDPNDETAELEEIPNKLPEQYGNAKTSNLKAKVEQGPTTLPPFMLNKPTAPAGKGKKPGKPAARPPVIIDDDM
ncbi:MAG TPA: hypothetical protein VNK04_12475 [Gemmataceae bacterium]|nr:hypothetical protein [Gemmataceae bacterium]